MMSTQRHQGVRTTVTLHHDVVAKVQEDMRRTGRGDAPMILVDANVLIHAHDRRSGQAARRVEWVPDREVSYSIA